VGSDEAHKSRDIPCFLTYDVSGRISAVQGHQRSLILVPIESEYATFY